TPTQLCMGRCRRPNAVSDRANRLVPNSPEHSRHARVPGGDQLKPPWHDGIQGVTVHFQEDRMIRRTITTGILSIAAVAMTASLALAQNRTSKPFTGAKVNAGTVTYAMKDGKTVLTLSDDFKVPDTPDPHWQVVDSKGNTYLLQRLAAKNLGG